MHADPQTLLGALLSVTVGLAAVGCARNNTATTNPDTSGNSFEITPAIAAVTGATAVVGLGILAIIACGIACAP